MEAINIVVLVALVSVYSITRMAGLSLARVSVYTVSYQDRVDMYQESMVLLYLKLLYCYSRTYVACLSELYGTDPCSWISEMLG